MNIGGFKNAIIISEIKIHSHFDKYILFKNLKLLFLIVKTLVLLWLHCQQSMCLA
jgi:hypothetical protein